FFQFSHGSIKRGGQEKDAQRPCMAGILDTHPHTVFAVLVLFDAAPVVITRERGTSCHRSPFFSWNVRYFRKALGKNFRKKPPSPAFSDTNSLPSRVWKGKGCAVKFLNYLFSIRWVDFWDCQNRRTGPFFRDRV